MFFFGQYDHSIDDKGRLTVPSQYRDLLAGGAYLTRGMEKNLIVIRSEDFQTLYHKMKATSLTDIDASDFGRLFFGNASLLELDKAGRILLPQFLRKDIDLDTQVKIVGLGAYFELWSPENWSGKEKILNDRENLANKLKNLNLTF